MTPALPWFSYGNRPSASIKEFSKQGNVAFDFERTSDAWHQIDARVRLKPDEMHSWPEGFANRLHVFDPLAIMVWVETIWQSPTGGTRKFGRNGIGRDPRKATLKIPEESCYSTDSEPPRVYLDLTFEGAPDESGYGFPGAYVPFDDRVLAVLEQESYKWYTRPEDPERDAHQFTEARAEAKAKHEAAVAEDVAYRWKQHEGYMKRLVESASDRELTEQPAPPGPKPFVEVRAPKISVGGPLLLGADGAPLPDSKPATPAEKE